MQPPTDQLTSARGVTDSRGASAGGLHQRIVTASGQQPEPKCFCGRKAYLIDPLFPYHCEQNRCWYHRGGTKWRGRVKEYHREYRKANRAKINARNRDKYSSKPEIRQRNAEYRKANLEKFREYNRAYRRRHGARINAARRGHYPKKKYDPVYFENYRKQNREKLRIESRAQGARQRAQLADPYIRRVLATGMRVPASEIPAAAIELNRAIIKIKRLWRNQKTSSNSVTNCSTPTIG